MNLLSKKQKENHDHTHKNNNIDVAWPTIFFNAFVYGGKMNKEIDKAIKVVIETMKKDSGYRNSWKCSIAVSYLVSERWYKEKTGKESLSRADKIKIANNAAEYFINLLTGTI